MLHDFNLAIWLYTYGDMLLNLIAAFITRVF